MATINLNSSGYGTTSLSKGTYKFTLIKSSTDDRDKHSISANISDADFKDLYPSSGCTLNVNINAFASGYTSPKIFEAEITGNNQEIRIELDSYSETSFTASVVNSVSWITLSNNGKVITLSPNNGDNSRTGSIIYNNYNSLDTAYINVTQQGAREIVKTEYSITDIAPKNSATTVVEYNVTSYTVQYTGKTVYTYANGETSQTTEPLTKTVSFSANATSNRVGRSGQISWNGQTADWQLGQYGAKEIDTSVGKSGYTYSIENVQPNSTAYTVASTATSQTITYDGVTTAHYHDKTTSSTTSSGLTYKATFDKNDGNSKRTINGEFTWNDTKGTYQFSQYGAKELDPSIGDGGYTYEVLVTDPISLTFVDWDSTSYDVKFTGTKIAHYIGGDTEIVSTESGLTYAATYSVNNGTSAVTHSGYTTWDKDGKVRTFESDSRAYWELKQHGGGEIDTSQGDYSGYTFSVISVTPNSYTTRIASDQTSVTVKFTGQTITYYYDPSKTRTATTAITSAVTVGANETDREKQLDNNSLDASKRVTWTPTPMRSKPSFTPLNVDWKCTQDAGIVEYTVNFYTNAPNGTIEITEA